MNGNITYGDFAARRTTRPTEIAEITPMADPVTMPATASLGNILVQLRRSTALAGASVADMKKGSANLKRLMTQLREESARLEARTRQLSESISPERVRRMQNNLAALKAEALKPVAV